MNPKLTKEIVKHIYNKLGIGSDLNKFYSILDNKFLLKDKICLIGEDDNTIENNIWASQLTYDDKKIRILVANCGIEEIEYCIVVSLEGIPSYGCYLSFDEEDSIICYSLSDKWSNASIYLQANFLAGMEQLKEVVGEWEVCKDVIDLKKNILSFIEYCDGVLNAR